jgi:hypothetical protein
LSPQAANNTVTASIAPAATNPPQESKPVETQEAPPVKTEVEPEKAPLQVEAPKKELPKVNSDNSDVLDFAVLLGGLILTCLVLMIPFL